MSSAVCTWYTCTCSRNEALFHSTCLCMCTTFHTTLHNCIWCLMSFILNRINMYHHTYINWYQAYSEISICISFEYIEKHIFINLYMFWFRCVFFEPTEMGTDKWHRCVNISASELQPETISWKKWWSLYQSNRRSG